jgi:hypothetical protein
MSNTDSANGHWRAPVTVPKDGSEVIVLGDTGVYLTYWAPPDDKFEAGWFCPITGSAMLDDDDILGWIPSPKTDWKALARLADARRASENPAANTLLQRRSFLSPAASRQW